MMKPIYALVFLLFCSISSRGAVMDLQVQRLAESLKLITEADRGTVTEALRLIEKGENIGALVKLTALAKTNPQNSSVRIVLSYALLKAGDLLGAFEQAKQAEAAPNGNSYKCWFLAKIALLTGNKQVCRAELKHVKAEGDMPAEVKSLENEMKVRFSRN
jgi:Flp pilus assembly protein TadD